jgi:hypothetical protein
VEYSTSDYSYTIKFEDFPEGQTYNAIALDFYAGDFYNRIHFFPARLEIGNLTADIMYDIEIFNGYFYPVSLLYALPLNAESLTGGGLVLPALINQLRSVMYHISVSLDGPAKIDALFTFLFDNNDRYDLEVTGNRLVTFAFSPNWDEKVTETISFLTDILESWDGTEQRIILRTKPRCTLSYSILESNISLFDNYMMGWGARTFVMPIWWRKTALLHPVYHGENTASCLTEGKGFKVGDLVVIWKSSSEVEAANIVALSSESITIDNTFGGSYSSGYMIPTRLCQLTAGDVNMETIQSNLFEASLQFDYTELETIPDNYTGDTFGSKYILPYAHDYTSPRPRGFTWKMIQNDTGTTLPYRKYLSEIPKDIIEIEDVLLVSHEDVEKYKAWLVKHMGRAKSFYVFLKENHFIVTKDIALNDTTLTVKASSYWVLEYQSDARMVFFLKTLGGKRYIFSPTGYAGAPGGDIMMSVNIPFDADIPVSNILYVGAVVNVRFDQDEFEIVHEQDILSRVSFKMKGLGN